MGILSKLTGNDSKGGMTHYGGHSLETSNVLDAVSDVVNPNAPIQWTVNTPTVVKTPTPSTETHAQQAELEAAKLKHGVDMGIRVLTAEEQKHQEMARLTSKHRRYLGKVAESHLQITQANSGLGQKLNGMREKYAALGFGLDRAVQTADHRINVLKARLRGQVE
jgi:hypothetical protein